MKVEQARGDMKGESKAYAKICSHYNSHWDLHIPRLFQCFSHGSKDMMVMELLDPSLQR
jgi:hypothetical protein